MDVTLCLMSTCKLIFKWRTGQSGCTHAFRGRAEIRPMDLRPRNRKQHSQSSAPDGTDWLIRAKQSVAVNVGVPAFHLGAVCNNQRAIGTEKTDN